MKKIAVLITCHNRKDKTLSCLSSLYNSILPDNYCYETFLVDDGSTDGTSNSIKKKFPNVKIIQGTGELYWNRGMNLAWENASKYYNFDYYLWLNDDTILLNNSLKEILLTSEKKNNNSIIVGTTISPVNRNVTYGGFNFNNKLIIPNNNINSCNYFNGNIVLIPKKVFKIVGYLDSFFVHCIGDFDYGLRAQKKDIESFVAPSILGYCDDHKNNPDWCLSNISFINRIKSLYSPLGNSHPFYFFKFELRHYGLVKAIKHFISIHLRLLVPRLWK